MWIRPLGLACALLVSVAPQAPASSAPQGREWAPVTDLAVPGVTEFGVPSLVHDAKGHPALVIGARRLGQAQQVWSILAWDGTAWVDSIVSEQRAGGIPYRPVERGGGSHLIGLSGRDPTGYARLLLWPVGSAIASPETVATTTDQGSGYAAALTAGRRWVSRIEQRPNEEWQVRTYFSDFAGAWQEVPRLGEYFHPYNCALAPLSETTALLVYAGFGGTFWTRLQGAVWADEPQPMHRAEGPMFVPLEDGGWWLVSSDRLSIHVDAWDGTTLKPVTLVPALRDPGRPFTHIGWLDVSPPADGTRPAIAWQENFAIGPTWHSAAHVAFPLKSGWSPGHQVPDSDDMYIGPTVTLDENGDGWVAWMVGGSPIPRWTHTYITAKCSTPRLVLASGLLRVEWELEQPVFGSAWTVLRAEGDGPFEARARIHAQEGTGLAWVDPDPPTGVLRYRIRRESVDERYSWESDAVTWGTVDVAGPPASTSGLRLRAVRNPVGAEARVELTAVTEGTVVVALHDVRGRCVSTVQVTVDGEESRTILLDLASRPPGVYFVIARDGDGRRSVPVRLVRVDSTR